MTELTPLGNLPHILFPEDVRKYIETIEAQNDEIAKLREELRVAHVEMHLAKRTATKALSQWRNGMHAETLETALQDIITNARR